MNRFFFSGFVILLTFSSIGQQNPCDPGGKIPYSKIPGDTTITLPSGTTITFNRCEFFDVRDCIQIIEINSAEEMRAQGINMYDRDGNILLTCGMVRVDMKNCGKPCFEVPLKIKIKVRFQDCSSAADAIPRLYLNNGSGWDLQENNKYRLTTAANKEQYLEFETACPVTFNCDVPKKGRKVKFVAPKGNKIQQLRMGVNCPLFFYDEKPAKAKRKVKLQLLCTNPDNMSVQSVQFTTLADSMISTSSRLSELQHGNKKVYCKRSKRPFFNVLFGWIGRGKGSFYRKYYLPEAKN